VAIAGWEGWSEWYDETLARAATVHEASIEPLVPGDDEASFAYTNRLLLGLARLRAERLDATLLPMAAWDGSEDGQTGGTATTLAWWRSLGHKVDVIQVDSLLRQLVPEVAEHPAREPSAATREPAASSHVTIKSILFADLVGYSHLGDELVPRFTKHFFNAVADLIERSGVEPAARNTWGDALYFVFDGIEEAGSFALDLCDEMAGIDWKAAGFSRDLTLRVALHAGPVYQVDDPVSNAPAYTGSHTIRAARLEPITPGGAVYCSEEFAALSEADGVRAYTTEYVGRRRLAKRFTYSPVYHLRRA
jgi:class 3 adenylate cyclase